MIITQLTGGLGNQMFQYACGFSISISKGYKYGYFFENPIGVYSKRKFELNIFHVKGKLLSSPEFTKAQFGDRGLIKYLKKMIKLPITQPYERVEEKGFPYNQIIPNIKDCSILSGYWQSEKYFQNNKKQIMNDFLFKYKITDDKNLYILKKIRENNAVSIHVRRGDYISDKNTNKFHGICSITYYQKAIQMIKRRVKNPLFIVFSDDPTWSRSNIKDKNAEYVNWNAGDSSWIDMYLMSHCRHNIIANSSFSWWGAWLNKIKNKVVIAPKQWFQDKSIDTRDLVPKSWLKI